MSAPRLVRIVLVFAALSTFLLSGVMEDVSPGTEAAATQWTDHGRIMIDSDSEFTAENGVASGSGTKSDPYIIEGWRIGPSPNVTAIDIHNTRSHFRIRDVYLFSCSLGILMNNVHDGRVENSQFMNCSVGVAVVRSDDCKITTSTFEGSVVAISISYSDVSQSDNTFINNVNDVTRIKNKVPWEQSWIGAAVCVAILIPLVAVITMLLYFRFRPAPPSAP